MRERADAIIDMVGLTARAGDKAGSLSYGEQRLVGFALALAVEPKMLLLDEPVSGMNASETQGFVRLIRKVRDEGVTILPRGARHAHGDGVCSPTASSASTTAG